MDQAQPQEKSRQKRVALIAALVTFVCVILLGVVVYFALDRAQFKRLPTKETPPALWQEAPPSEGSSPQDR